MDVIYPINRSINLRPNLPHPDVFFSFCFAIVQPSIKPLPGGVQVFDEYTSKSFILYTTPHNRRNLRIGKERRRG